MCAVCADLSSLSAGELVLHVTKVRQMFAVKEIPDAVFCLQIDQSGPQRETQLRGSHLVSSLERSARCYRAMTCSL
jgi:hypothetical protein